MRGARYLVLGTGVLFVGIACSAGAGPTKQTTSSGNGGAAAGPGAGGAQTSSVSTVGIAVSTATGPMFEIDAGDPKDAADDVPVDTGTCDDLQIQTQEVVPTVLLLVDTSSSMFEPRTQLWDPLYNALMDPTNGVVAKLQSKVRFGFTSFKSVTQPVLDPTCPILQSTDFKVNNFDEINTTYTAAGTYTGTIKWETPTGASVRAVTQTLLNFMPVPTGPKFILLVTDGNPDSCKVRDPQCGEDESIKAVQDAYTAGIGTFVIGIGDILTDNSGCVGRCGVDHLKDLANAGTGMPVAPNSMEYAYSQCVGDPTKLTATYAATVADQGTAVPATVSATDAAAGQTQLVNAITAALAQTRDCTFQMNAKITGDASLGTLDVNGNKLTFGDANGWQLGADLASVTLSGTACTDWKANGGMLHVSFPCKLVPVVPLPPIPPPE